MVSVSNQSSCGNDPCQQETGSGPQIHGNNRWAASPTLSLRPTDPISTAMQAICTVCGSGMIQPASWIRLLTGVLANYRQKWWIDIPVVKDR